MKGQPEKWTVLFRNISPAPSREKGLPHRLRGLGRKGAGLNPKSGRGVD